MAVVIEMQNLTAKSLLGILVRKKMLLPDDKMVIISFLEQAPASFININREQFDSMLKDVELYWSDRKCECLAEAARRQKEQSSIHGHKLTTMWTQINRYADYRCQPIIAFIFTTIIEHVEL